MVLTLARACLLCLALSALCLAGAQQPFTLGTEVTVVAAALNVREAPGTSAVRIGQQQYGARGVVLDASPYWSEGFWWWMVGYRDGTRGWSAEGDASMAFLSKTSGGLPLERSEAEWQAMFFSGDVMVNCSSPLMDWSGETLHVGGLQRCREPVWSSSIPGFEEDAGRYRREEHTVLGIQLKASLEMPHGVVSLLAILDRRIGGNNHYEALLVYLQSAADGYDGLIARVNGQWFTVRPRSSHVEVAVATYVPLPGDSYLAPSIEIESTFELTQQSIALTGRSMRINEHGTLARSLERAESQRGRTLTTADINRVANDVSSAALNSATRSDFEQDLRRLENTYGIDLLTTAVRVLPIYDSRAGTWQSFDSWARSEARRSGADAPFTRDPIGSTVSILLNPSAGNISRQLGLGDPPW